MSVAGGESELERGFGYGHVRCGRLGGIDRTRIRRIQG